MLRSAVLLAVAAVAVVSTTTVPSIPLYNAAVSGLTMPVIGLGTFGYGIDPQGDGGEFWNYTLGYNATRDWIKLGGRRIDSASSYLTQGGVGQAIKDSGINRADLFITSKTSPSGYNGTMLIWEGVLKIMQLDYVDLLLIHWPGPCTTPGLKPTECRQQAWQALTDIFNSGKARAIGVSNFETNHIQDILDMKGLVPSVNQVEYHPYWHEDDLRTWCQSRNISVESYSPLGAPDHMAFSRSKWPVLVPEQPELATIGVKYNKTPSQVVLRWAWQKNITANPRTYKVPHMQENMDIFDFTLSAADMAQVDNLPNEPAKGQNKVCPDPNHIP